MFAPNVIDCSISICTATYAAPPVDTAFSTLDLVICLLLYLACGVTIWWHVFASGKPARDSAARNEAGLEELADVVVLASIIVIVAWPLVFLGLLVADGFAQRRAR